MSILSLLLSCFLLYSSSVDLLVESEFGSFVSLCFDQFSVSNLFILFLLLFHNSVLFFFKNLHSGLIKGFFTKNIKHRFNFSIKIEQCHVTFVNLCGFAAVFWRHAWLEQRYWRSVKIELCCDTNLSFRRLVCKLLNIFDRLDLHMRSAWYRLWSCNITIRINIPS